MPKKMKAKTPKQVKKSKLFNGKFIGNERGFGFVQREDGEDVFIPPTFTCGALNGDEVAFKINARKPSEEAQQPVGEIIEITRRMPMIGTVLVENGAALVRPSSRKVPYSFEVPQKSVTRFGLADGHRIVFSVDKKHRPDKNLSACFVTELLGHINDPGVDVLSLVRMAGVPYEFPQEVTDELQKVPSEVQSQDLNGRRDLRGEYIFTIDGDDTKDIDDAISFAKTEHGFSLGVHIADVSHYVRQHSATDDSALSRGTSIYLADRVIPMLPHTLSSGICSLFPNVDRLTLSCQMQVDRSGIVTDYEIFTSVINSKRRFTYNEVQGILDGGNGDDFPLVRDMDELRKILRKKRDRRGALDFDLPEAKIRVDENGRVVSIEPYPRNNATCIIEEFMILCNETIASHFLTEKIPFIYRTHEQPNTEKLAALQTMVENLGLELLQPKTRRTTAKSLQKLLETAKETPAAFAVSSALLRALPRANYTPDNPNHFGLASKSYCHFTSPIRRYADLQIHRIIKDYVLKVRGQGDNVPLQGVRGTESPEVLFLHTIAAQCSKTERTAEALERDVEELKKVQFMADKKGESFSAIVSGVTSWGVYVMLENTAEGLLPASNLQRHKFKFNKDYEVYEKKRERGQKTGKILRHGSPIAVRLTGTDEDERRLNFVMDDE
ncbi:MAG: ribonuclease R [Defluviitaleaceae bacterium]|nr:ribonuclease R [Defluviitaleaceae bacterium]MCL2262961.1 ribonuclease R [Defluviitaleaceae bacterium]